MTIFIFYLVSYICSYFYLKFCIVQDGKYEWTKEDRIVGLILSIGGLLTIILVCALILVIENVKDLSKPVKW